MAVLSELSAAVLFGLLAYLAQERLLLAAGSPDFLVGIGVWLSPLFFFGWIEALACVAVASVGVRWLRKRLQQRD